MSGHSKWSTIKRAKGAADAKRSQIFTKLANAISVAAKAGADIGMNGKLRLAVERARALSMPKDNIERAIKRGAGGEGMNLEEVRYEAYGPGGVAFLIDALTNNHNRTSANIRHLLERHGGRLAEAGSVAWMFQIKGLLLIPTPTNRDEVELALIEAGAEDIVERDTELEIKCNPEAFEAIKTKLTELNITPTYSSLEPVANTTATVEGHALQQLEALREVLDEDEDVTDLFDNQA